MSAQHTIGRQILQLQTTRFAGAVELQQALSRAFWARMVPALERVFDRHAGPDRWLRLDSLEIDLGPINQEWLDDQSRLEELLFEKAEAALLEAIRNAHLDTEPPRTGPQRHFDLWLYWLLHGALPMHAARPAADWLTQVLQTLGTEQQAVSRLHGVLLRAPQALRRLALQHEPAFLKSMLELHSGQSQQVFAALVQEVKMALTGPRSGVSVTALRALEIWIWEAALRETVLLQRPWTAEHFSRLLQADSPLLVTVPALKKAVERKKNTFPTLRALLDQTAGLAAERRVQPETGQAPPQSKTAPKLAEQSAQAEPAPPAVGNTVETPAPPAVSGEIAGAQPELVGELREVFPKPPEKTRPAGPADPVLAEVAGGYFVQQAGLVLLHPFLQRFFSKFDLLDGSDFRDETARHRAILFLQVLAGGETSGPDYNLILPKFLCAMPLNQPIDHTLSASPEEQEEANRLLQAAIEHWGALGSTSPDGLREGFLQRPGKLEHTGTGWRMQVERRTLDILLDRLPWNLSLVKLPWMPELLHIDWR